MTPQLWRLWLWWRSVVTRTAREVVYWFLVFRGVSDERARQESIRMVPE